MKKVLLSVAAVATLGLGMTSCGGIDTEAAAKEFCECKDSEDKGKCHDEWIEKYKGGKASKEDATKMGEAMVECDPMGAIEALPKFQEASK